MTFASRVLSTIETVVEIPPTSITMHFKPSASPSKYITENDYAKRPIPKKTFETKIRHKEQRKGEKGERG
jgi:hypothetical protein